MERIGIDLDEVVFNFVDPFIRFANKKHGTTFSRTDLATYHFEECGIIPLGTNNKLVTEFTDLGLLRTLPLVEHAYKALQILDNIYEIIYLTSRHDSTAKDTALSLTDYGIWHPVHFSTAECTKADLMKNLNIECLIDDSPRYIDEARIKIPSAKTILFSNVPQSIKVANFNYHARNWPEALFYALSD